MVSIPAVDLNGFNELLGGTESEGCLDIWEYKLRIYIFQAQKDAPIITEVPSLLLTLSEERLEAWATPRKMVPADLVSSPGKDKSYFTKRV